MNEQDEQFNCNSSNASVTSSNSCGGVNTTSTTNFTCNLQQSLTEVKQSETFSIDTKYFNEDASINTPPQLISTAVNKIPFPKKFMSKRLPIKPLCGQNTGNLANIALSQASSRLQTQVRRSSRIFAQSANAVKENKKLPSVAVSKHPCISSINKDESSHKNSKKFKFKKKIDTSSTDGSVAPSSSTNSQESSSNQLKSSNDASTMILKNIPENSGSLSYVDSVLNNVSFLDRNSKQLDMVDDSQKTKLGKVQFFYFKVKKKRSISVSYLK